MYFCKVCTQTKPADRFEIRSDTGKPRTVCKDCRNANNKARYAADPNIRARVQANNERWRAENAEHYAEYKRQYHADNREVRNERSRQWQRDNRQRANETATGWRAENREHMQELERSRKQANPDHYRAKVRNRRARLKAVGEHTAQDVRRMFEIQSGLCNGCKCDLRTSDYHVDHIMPLSRGGNNSPGNLQLLCPPCNLSKGAKTMREWLTKRK